MDHEYWARTAEAYDWKNQYVVGSEAQRLLYHWLEERIRDVDHVLELGCGTGLFSRVIAPRAKHLTATDLSDEMLLLAKKRLAGFHRVVVQKENSYQLSFPGATFDCVFLGNIIHVVTKPDDVLQESYRVLKPGGRLLVVDATAAGLSFGSKLKMSLRYLKAFGLPPRTNKSLTTEQITGMCKTAGFSILESDVLGTQSRSICVFGEK